MAFRRRLSPFAGLWLCCQLLTLALAPVSLLAHSPQAADAIACTCSHTGHDECPMHHPKQKKGCQCRSTQDPDAASLVSLLGPIAVLSNAPAALTAPSSTASPIHQLVRFTNPIVPVEGPPPRA